jgi:hypothetical protein
MTQLIDVPGMGEVEFPDDMSDEQISSAIKQSLGPQQRSFGSELSRQAQLTGRDVLSGVAALPAMAMDAGVAARNLTEGAVRKHAPGVASGIDKLAMSIGIPSGPGAPYSMPSQDFQSALTQAGLPEAEGPAERAMSFIRQAMTGSRIAAPQAAQQAPKDFQPAQQALRNQVLQKAQSEGYVTPPSAGNPSTSNRLLEGIAGKIKLSQESMMRNQPVTEKLAARALGQNPDAPLTQGALQVIRKEAHDAGYLPVKAVGEIATDSKFLDDLVGITKTAQGASRSFPGLKPPSEIDDVVNTLAQDKFDASDGIDAIQYLRDLADDAYSGGNRQLGKAYKTASKAVEDMIERALEKGIPAGAKPREIPRLIMEEGGQNIADVARTMKELPPVPAGHTRLFRASSPTVKFSDIFKPEMLEKFQPKGMKGDFYTSDLGYADYFRASYGKTAKISYLDVPTPQLAGKEINPGEFVVDPTAIKSVVDSKSMLKNYRDARKLIAQTYTAGKGLVDETGGTAAGKYATELVSKKKPLVGDQKTIADFASTFGKYNFGPKQLTDIYPSISPLDAYGSAIAAGATDSVAPLALPLTRVGLREYLLSQAGQARAIRAPYVTPQNLGLLGAYPIAAQELQGLLGQ